MPGPKLRLALFAAGLAALALAALLVAPVDRGGLRDLFEPLGAGAPLAFVVVSGILGSLFVPGPVLAGASGLLFGVWTGFCVTLGSTVLTSVLAVTSARGAGRPGVVEFADPRVERFERLASRRPALTVALQRLLPGIPDAPFSYLYGLAGLALWPVVVGTMIGAAPRAFSYTAIGDGLGGGGRAVAVAGLVTLTLSGVAGLAVGAVAARRTRDGRR